MAEFQRHLGQTMRYDKVELQRYLVSGEDVAAIFLGEGIARASGRPFRSEIVRLYTIRDGKIVRVSQLLRHRCLRGRCAGTVGAGQILRLGR